MTMMQQGYEGSVGPDEIDDLGHMNIKYYGEKAEQASRSLAAALGLGATAIADEDGAIYITEAHTRYYEEQTAGASVSVIGGVRCVDDTALHLYLEMHNRDTGARAATFNHKLQVFDRPHHRLIALPSVVVDKASRQIVDWPDHGRPRSLDLDPPPAGLTVEELERHSVASGGEHIVHPRLCDQHGYLVAGTALGLAFALRGPMPDGYGAAVFSEEGDRRLGWANMENRVILLRTPRVNDRVKSFMGEVEIGRKTRVSRHWTFDMTTNELLGINESVLLAFDTTARRSVEIPGAMRKVLERNYHPELR